MDDRTHSKVKQRGATLVELLVAIAIAAMLAGGAVAGVGALSSARLRQSASLIASAVRIAYNHANATSRTTRLVFDFNARTVSIEDSAGKMFIQSGDRTGGAAAANEVEQAVVEESEAILEGPRAPRPQFSPVKNLLGFEGDKGRDPTKPLGDKIYFRQIEVGHEEEAVTQERVYLYFFPGGQTERASIQVQKGADPDVEENRVLSITVAPLTGKVVVIGGSVDMPRPQSDEEASERSDSAF
jgi:general secretion pathway protein H